MGKNKKTCCKNGDPTKEAAVSRKKFSFVYCFFSESNAQPPRTTITTLIKSQIYMLHLPREDEKAYYPKYSGENTPPVAVKSRNRDACHGHIQHEICQLVLAFLCEFHVLFIATFLHLVQKHEKSFIYL